MKKWQTIFWLLCVISIIEISCNSGDGIAQKRNFEKQLGTYSLDLDKTNFGNFYPDYQLYKKLQITFFRDSTFRLNMKVPFIFDSTGKWIPAGGGLEDWNWLFYKSNENISTQFTEPWTIDSIFYMNSTTPQKGEKNIKEIYFKKISSNL